MPLHLDPLAAGAALAICLRTKSLASAIARSSVLLFWISVALLAYMAVTTGGLFYWHWGPLWQVAGYAALAMAGATAIALAVKRYEQHRPSWLRTPLLVWFGKYSYAIYVFHVWFDTVARRYDLHPSQNQPILESALLTFGVYSLCQLTITSGAAWVSWNLLEKHALSLKRYFEIRVDGSNATTEERPIEAPSEQPRGLSVEHDSNSDVCGITGRVPTQETEPVRDRGLP